MRLTTQDKTPYQVFLFSEMSVEDMRKLHTPNCTVDWGLSPYTGSMWINKEEERLNRLDQFEKRKEIKDYLMLLD